MEHKRSSKLVFDQLGVDNITVDFDSTVGLESLFNQHKLIAKKPLVKNSNGGKKVIRG